MIDDRGDKISLTAELPFLLPKSTYKFPDLDRLFGNNGKNQEWLVEWLKEAGVIRRWNTGKDILEKTRDSVAGAAFFVPNLDPLSEAMQIYAAFFVESILLDDVIEARNILGREGVKGLKFTNTGSEIIQGKYKTMEELPGNYPALTSFLRSCFLASQKARNLFPEWTYNCQYFAASSNETMEAMALLQIEDSLQLERNLPEATFEYLRYYEAGIETFIELAALVSELYISDAIRRTLYFRHAMSLARSIATKVNDLIGVQRDLRTQEGFSIILYNVRQKNIPLATAYKNLQGTESYYYILNF